MPEIVIPPTFLLVAGGATFSIPVDDNNKIYRITGTETITGSNVFQESGSAAEGMTYIYQYEGVSTYTGGFVVSFHGTSMSSFQALKDHLVVAQYRGAAWIVDFYPDLAENNIIEITKLANLTSAYIVLGNSSNVPTATAVTGVIAISNTGVTSHVAGSIVNADINASAAIALSKLAAMTSGYLLVGSAGTVPTAVAMSGDATIVASGALTIANLAVSRAKLAADAVSLSKLNSTGQLYSYSTTTGTPASTVETTLASFAIPTYGMDADGEVLEVYAYGSFAANANNKTVRIRLGATLATATQLCANNTTAAPNGLNWEIRARIFRNGAASQKGQASIVFSAIAAELDNFTATETWATSTIYLSGTNGTAAANDIVLEGFQVINARTDNN